MVLKLVSAAALSLAALATSATAATIDFTGATGGQMSGYQQAGFVVDGGRVVNGNCDSSSGPSCAALNNNDKMTVTSADGGAFSLSSFWFKHLGRGTNNLLTVTSSSGATLNLSQSAYAHNTPGGFTYDLTGVAGFTDVTSVTFTTSNGGNVRIDGLSSLTPVPLPAAGFMLLAGLGALTLLRRKSA